MQASNAREVLSLYPGFFYCKFLKNSRSVLIANSALTFFFTISIILGAARDGSFFLEGKDVGLLEHPAIFSFLIAQCILPFSILRAIDLFISTPSWNSILSQDFLSTQFGQFKEWMINSARRDTPLGSSLYMLLIAIGFSAFAWNSLSNQDPFHFVGFDFWDSSNHFWGYWITRVYKFYMWVLFIPALVHIEMLILISMRRSVVLATLRQQLILMPFHPDQSGGIRSLMDTILIPLIPPLFISSVLALSAVMIHERLDVTTIGGLVLVCLTFLSFYFPLATVLRHAVVAEKLRQLKLIAKIQNDAFMHLVQSRDVDGISAAVEEKILALENLATHVRSIPNWPQLRFVLKAVSLAGSSPILTWLFGLLSPKIIHILGL